MPKLTAQEQLWRTVAEAEVQEQLRQLADLLHAPYHHETDSRKSPKGWPDTAIATPPVLWIIEAKTETGRLKPEQLQWALVLQECRRVEYRLARPSGMEKIMQEIIRERR